MPVPARPRRASTRTTLLLAFSTSVAMSFERSLRVAIVISFAPLCVDSWNASHGTAEGAPSTSPERPVRDPDLRLGSQPFGQVFDGDRVAVLDRVMGGVEELEEDVSDPDGRQRPAKTFGAEVEEILVAPARIDVDGAHLAQGVGVTRHHANRVPAQPAFPDLGNHPARRGVVGQAHGAVLIGGVAGRHAPVVEQLPIPFLAERRPAAEVLPELLERTLVLVT